MPAAFVVNVFALIAASQTFRRSEPPDPFAKLLLNTVAAIAVVALQATAYTAPPSLAVQLNIDESLMSRMLVLAKIPPPSEVDFDLPTVEFFMLRLEESRAIAPPESNASQRENVALKRLSVDVTA